MSAFDTTASLLSGLIPVVTGLVALVSAFVFLGRGSVRFGKFRFDFEKQTAEKISRRIEDDLAHGASPQNALMREYHAQGLSQSRVSFWFSLVFASLGFAIIALSIVLFIQNDQDGAMLQKTAKPAFTLVAGTIIDSVAALFFVQSNKARQLMVDFFDKLRVDRKLDEALSLLSTIDDPLISSKARSIVALNFADVPLEASTLASMFLAVSPTNPIGQRVLTPPSSP